MKITLSTPRGSLFVIAFRNLRRNLEAVTLSENLGMAAPRKPLKFVLEGKSFVVRCKHPVSKTAVRFSLGQDHEEAKGQLVLLNRVFMDPAQWEAPDLPDGLKDQWLGAKAGTRATRTGIEADGEAVPVNAGTVAALQSVVETQEFWGRHT